VADSEDEIVSDEETRTDEHIIIEADSSDAVVGELFGRFLTVDNEFFVSKVCLILKVDPRAVHGCKKYEISTNQQNFKSLKLT
jgi:hypothetical protein